MIGRLITVRGIDVIAVSRRDLGFPQGSPSPDCKRCPFRLVEKGGDGTCLDVGCASDYYYDANEVVLLRLKGEPWL